jgi:hypothetical protein
VALLLFFIWKILLFLYLANYECMAGAAVTVMFELNKRKERVVGSYY